MVQRLGQGNDFGSVAAIHDTNHQPDSLQPASNSLDVCVAKRRKVGTFCETAHHDRVRVAKRRVGRHRGADFNASPERDRPPGRHLIKLNLDLI